MNRRDLQLLARMRIGEAKVLLREGMDAGAYYLVGYSIECALKACIAKRTRRSTFPDKRLANEAHTHDLEKLLRIAELQKDLEREFKQQPALELNWQTVKDWSEEARYLPQIHAAVARDMLSACTSSKHGVLAWVRKRW